MQRYDVFVLWIDPAETFSYDSFLRGVFPLDQQDFSFFHYNSPDSGTRIQNAFWFVHLTVQL